MNRRKTTKRAVREPMSSHDVSALIGPIINFLHKSGYSKKDILAECRAATQKVGSTRFKLPVIHVEFAKDAINIVNRWLRDPKYLNRHGRPDDLPLMGLRSLNSLVKDCKAVVTAGNALKHLLKFQIVTHVPTNRFRLIKRSMDFSHAGYLPFEPNFRFLVDATRAATSRLQHPKNNHKLFWQCADNTRIDARLTREFLSFVERRGLSFMHEINDWLDEHEIEDSTRVRRKAPMKRLGVSLFGIASDP